MSSEAHSPNPLDAIGIDAEIASMIRYDITGKNQTLNPENAGIWAELISEAAVRTLGLTSLKSIGNRLDAHLWRAVAQGTGSTATDWFTHRLERGLESVWDVEWIEDGDSTDTGDYDEKTENSNFYTPRQLGEWMQWCARFENAKQIVRNLTQQYLYEEMNQEEFEELRLAIMRSLQEMDAAMEWRNELFDWDVWGGSTAIPASEFPIPGTGAFAYLPEEYRTAEQIVGQIGINREYVKGVMNVIESKGDIAEIEKHRQLYGAKAANLLYLQKIFTALIEDGFYFNESGYVIPPFTAVATDTYDRWRTGEGITTELAPYVEWMQRFPVDMQFMVRSSAVYSEDGEAMAAGIYKSIRIGNNGSVEELLSAVEVVYRSVYSEEAVLYRANRGIVEAEKMGIVLHALPHELVDDDDVGYITVDTLRPGTPKLATYREDTRWMPDGENLDSFTIVLRRQGMLRELGASAHKVWATRFHTAPDTGRHSTIFSLDSARLASIAELAFGRPVQVELVASRDNRGDAFTYLVQARPLPEAMTEAVAFDGFPENTDDEVFLGHATGVMNGVEAVVVEERLLSLSDKLLPNEQPIVLFCGSQFGYSIQLDRVRQEILSLPAVTKNNLYCLIAERAAQNSSGGGHLETLMAELGVPLIFNDGAHTIKEHLKSGMTVRLYSDGVVGKVYKDNLTDPPFYSTGD